MTPGGPPAPGRLARLIQPVALREAWRERMGGHPVAEHHRPHLEAALDWLARAQDATGTGGIARGYALTWNNHLRLRGWEPAYPETTGYIIPTLYAAADHLERPDLATRADRAAYWECDVQLPSGAVRGGVIGQPVSPSVFNTGQVILGWLAAHERTGADALAAAAARAARFLIATLDDDGLWRRGTSQFAARGPTLYNTRTAWALAEAGVRLDMPQAVDAAARALHAAARRQHDNGWIPDCCLTDAERPLLHTLAYATRGLIEGGRVLGDGRLMAHGVRAAAALASAVEPDGWLPGRFTSEWKPGAHWSCLTGNAQMVNVWLRLRELTGDQSWLAPVGAVLQFLKSTQNRDARDPGLRGGIKGSSPVSGDYGRYEVLSWATKFFADALLRHERVLSRGSAPSNDALPLA